MGRARKTLRALSFYVFFVTVLSVFAGPIVYRLGRKLLKL